MKARVELFKDDVQWGACVVRMMYFQNISDITPYNQLKSQPKFRRNMSPPF
jgi:hypothetical protein